MDKKTIYNIETDDELLAEDMGKLIIDINKSLKELKEAISLSGDFLDSEKFHSLYESFISLKDRADRIARDVNEIVDREIREKKYVIVHDDDFISDKIKHLNSIKKNIGFLLQIFEQSPSDSDLKQGVIDQMVEKSEAIHNDIGRILRVDGILKRIYEKLQNL